MGDRPGLPVTVHAQLESAWRVRCDHFPPVIRFDYPLDTAVVSLTGAACDLNCAHCGRHYLGHMIPIEQAPERVGPARSLLISGGCDTEGRVPVNQQHLEVLELLRSGRTLNWHVGLVTEEQLEPILPYVDCVSFDFVGDDETIDEVYGLRRTVGDYVASYRLLKRHVPVIPHLTVGLRGGRLGHERKALRLLGELGCDAMVILVFIPTPGTRYGDCRPPSAAQVACLLAEARISLPETRLYLGCMRPHGAYRRQLDPLAVRAGVNRIVSPSREAVAMAEELGLTVNRGTECCVLDARPVPD
jgi:uncharacterized radical SAM superfamily protein